LLRDITLLEVVRPNPNVDGKSHQNRSAYVVSGFQSASSGKEEASNLRTQYNAHADDDEHKRTLEDIPAADGDQTGYQERDAEHPAHREKMLDQAWQ